MLCGALSLSATAHAQQGSWYAGVAAGVSRLTPDTDESDFTLDDEASVAAGLYLGLDLSERLGIEAAWTQLGEAGLSDDEDVEYSALSLSGVAHVMGHADSRDRHAGWSAFVRLGLSKISNEADIALSEKDNTAIWAGAGVQWPVSDSWGVRAELASFDGDAQAAMASLYWRPTTGNRSRSGSRVGRTDSASPAQTDNVPSVIPRAPAEEVSATQSEDTAEPAARLPEAPSVPSTATEPADTAVRPVPPTVVTVDPPLSVAASSCAVPAEEEPLDAQGCALFSGVQQGVDFVGESTTLTRVGQALLSRLAGSLNLYPELTVEIRVHTQSLPTPGRAQALSRDRAIAVARFLVAEGVDVKRLKARAFGDTQPRASNETAGGRRLNNRVELRVL